MQRAATGGGSKAPFLEEQNNSRDLGSRGGKRKRGIKRDGRWLFRGEGGSEILRGLGFHESSLFKGQSGYYDFESMERRLNTLDNARRFFFSKEVFCSLTLDAAKDSPFIVECTKELF